MRQLLRILVALSIILATVTFVDVVFGVIIDRLYIDSDCTKFGYSVNSNENPDIVIVGSSRAQHHYDTPYINDSLNISALNLGEAGRGLTYSNAVVASYLQKHHPKIIILELLPEDLSGRLNNRIKPLYPFIDSFQSVSDVAYDVDPLNSILLRSHLLRYNGELIKTIQVIIHPYKNTQFGYIPLRHKKRLNIELLEGNVTEDKVDKIALKCLTNIGKLCKENDVKLLVAFSPEYVAPYPLPHKHLITEQLNIKLLDYRNYYVGPIDDFFYDNHHLTEYGAREYTKYFMRELKQTLQDDK